MKTLAFIFAVLVLSAGSTFAQTSVSKINKWQSVILDNLNSLSNASSGQNCEYSIPDTYFNNKPMRTAAFDKSGDAKQEFCMVKETYRATYQADCTGSKSTTMDVLWRIELVKDRCVPKTFINNNIAKPADYKSSTKTEAAEVCCSLNDFLLLNNLTKTNVWVKWVADKTNVESNWIE